jgi:hypothetical protein
MRSAPFRCGVGLIRACQRNLRNPPLRQVAKHVGSLLAKLDLPPDADDHRRVRAVLAYLRG